MALQYIGVQGLFSVFPILGIWVAFQRKNGIGRWKCRWVASSVLLYTPIYALTWNGCQFLSHNKGVSHG